MLGGKRRNQPKSLSGIETRHESRFWYCHLRRNQPKSLSGIETILWLASISCRRAGINLNPYQGLKPNFFQDLEQLIMPEST